ncbi:hypothetical protein [Anaeromyxobacter oryzae]|uniref:SPW repeat protein n=1 Tax=Anaeromyxobacter oryzae TaxID=2918170 RepID=A0ABM7X1K7_9BACT|nr:hypothetical protein [Anaeromyxobacter oryzae]BDG05668.1 hypothetical protein AMOR_46640 [Anaeromyxobacter oryzae]
MFATSEREPPEKRLHAGGWGLLFIWVGIALATRIGWGATLVGVGLITLGVQVARKLMGLALDRFSLTVGGLFVAGGIWESVSGSVELVPLLCIGLGVALIVSALAGWPRRHVDSGAPGAPATHRPA